MADFSNSAQTCFGAAACDIKVKSRNAVHAGHAAIESNAFNDSPDMRTHSSQQRLMHYVKRSCMDTALT
eukprot:11348610-Alexandrium_andersonii.AAC.1